MKPEQYATFSANAGLASQDANAILWGSPSKAALHCMMIEKLRQAALAAGYTLTPIAQETQE